MFQLMLDRCFGRSGRTGPARVRTRWPGVVEVAVLELRRQHPSWGARRIVYELAVRRTVAEALARQLKDVWTQLSDAASG